MSISNIFKRLNFYKRLTEAERDSAEFKAKIIELMILQNENIDKLCTEIRKISINVSSNTGKLISFEKEIKANNEIAKTNIEHYANEYFKIKNELKLNQKVKVINLDLPKDLNIEEDENG